jgi:hypothetical protein
MIQRAVGRKGYPNEEADEDGPWGTKVEVNEGRDWTTGGSLRNRGSKELLISGR